MTGIQVRFLGSGDAVASAGRFQACILVTNHERRILLDCGASSIVALKRAGIDPSTIDLIVISHLHGDHFAGIPFLVLDGQFAHRTRPLALVGPVDTEQRVRTAMVTMYPGFADARLGFPLTFSELAPGDELSAAGAVVRVWSVPHDPLSNPLALRLTFGGVAIGYSGDTAWTPLLAEVAHGTDLFICEAQTLAPKARIHISYAEVLAHREDLGARRIVLTHMGADVIGASDLEIERATDGMTVTLSVR